jgi:prepilin-type N-terminal cleavage/methylation domain-containing protein
MNNKGFSLVEALISMAILSFVIVNILGGFSFQQMSSRKDAEKNMAILLADMRMQDLDKFYSNQLTPGVTTEFIVHKGKNFQVYSEADNPHDQDQFRRTTIIAPVDLLGNVMIIRVMVEYGLKNDQYPFRVVLSTRRGSQ